MLNKSSITKRSAMLALLLLGVLLGAAQAQTETVLYMFCSQADCADGQNPYAGLVSDSKGNLYGTTVFGGAYTNPLICRNGRCGTIFKLSPEGKETVLYSFCAQNDCADGGQPMAGLIFDRKGNLYGTTNAGGPFTYSTCYPTGCGVVFKLTPDGKETTLYSFCKLANCADGSQPYAAGLVLDKKGNLYGTTYFGGAYGEGVVFKLTPAGKETVLYSFCPQTGCSDGAQPISGVVFDEKGNLYGTTNFGGAYNGCQTDGCGVVFELTPEGKETVLYNFCAQSNCADGFNPNAGVVLDKKGNIYGAAEFGGAHKINGGTIFKLTPEGKETTLYSFCAQSNCTDGQAPFRAPILDKKGNLYGTAVGYGPHYGGVVYKLTPQGGYTILYGFCTETDCDDGKAPTAGLIFDSKGNLYGTTYNGGPHENSGVVFKLTP